MTLRRWIPGLIGLLLTFPAIPAGAAEGVTIFAAASLRGALDEISAQWDAPVTISYGSSGSMARQISLGAPADLVILAHPDWMDWLQANGFVRPGARRDIVGNSLVLIGPAGAPPLPDPDTADLNARLGGGLLSMGQPDASPAGTYARAWLRHIGAWDRLEPGVATADNVRAALAYVSSGALPLGIVYASDAMADPRVAVLWTIPPDQHPPIRYPAAALNDRVLPFLDLLVGPDAQAVFAAHGFVPLGHAE